MASFLGRSGRRRRVLNEEVLSASSAHLAMRSAGQHDTASDGGARYSEAAGVENHPQITDFLPRRFRAVALVGFTAVASTAALEALYYFAAPVAAQYMNGNPAPFDLAAPGSLAGWLSSVLMLLSAATCLVIYSLRRHRIDDYRGRYRIWLAAAIACTALSINSVAPLHSLVAVATASRIGWSALRGHAIWWLAIGGLPLAWISLRAWFDARESKLSFTAMGAAFAAYAVATFSYLASWPASDPYAEVMITAGAALVGHWMLLLSVVSYGRFVVLDAQGLVQRSAQKKARKPRAKAPEQKAAAATRTSDVRKAEATAPSQGASLKAFRQSIEEAKRQRPAAAAATQWTDGTDSDDESYDDDSEGDGRDRKLSKAERKRMRKLKAQNRAA